MGKNPDFESHRVEARNENALFLLDSGMSFEAVAAECGLTEAGLRKTLYRRKEKQ